MASSEQSHEYQNFPYIAKINIASLLLTDDSTDHIYVLCWATLILQARQLLLYRDVATLLERFWNISCNTSCIASNPRVLSTKCRRCARPPLSASLPALTASIAIQSCESVS